MNENQPPHPAITPQLCLTKTPEPAIMYVAGQAGESHGTAFNCQFHVKDVESINQHISCVLWEHTLEVVRRGSVSSQLHPLVLPTCTGCTLPLWVYFKGIIPARLPKPESANGQQGTGVQTSSGGFAAKDRVE